MGFDEESFTSVGTKGRSVREIEYSDPVFEIFFTNDSSVDLWEGTGYFGLGTTDVSLLGELTRLARSKNVEFELSDFYEKSKFEELSNSGKTKRLYEEYEFLENIAISSGSDGSATVYDYKEITYQLLSVAAGPEVLPGTLGLDLDPENNSHFTMIKLGIKNNSDSEYNLLIRRLNNAYVINKAGKKFYVNAYYDEKVDFQVAPGAEVVHELPFDLPADLNGFQLALNPALLEDKVLFFNINMDE